MSGINKYVFCVFTFTDPRSSRGHEGKIIPRDREFITQGSRKLCHIITRETKRLGTEKDIKATKKRPEISVDIYIYQVAIIGLRIKILKGLLNKYMYPYRWTDGAAVSVTDLWAGCTVVRTYGPNSSTS